MLLAIGCNQAALSPNSDGGSDLASAFCTGQARVELNGMRADSPSVTAQPLYLNCCEAAELSIVSMQIAEPLVFSWRSFVGTMPSPPTTLDLAALPQGWSVSLSSGCTSLQSGCQPTDTLTEGFSGTLTIDGSLFTPGGYTMSVCLTVAEPASEPHPVLHSARLWSPTIAAK